LDFIHDVCDDGLLHDRGALHHAAHVGSGGLLDVLLDVVDDVLVDLTMHNGLHLHDAVLADGLLHDWGHIGCGLVHNRLSLLRLEPNVLLGLEPLLPLEPNVLL